MQNIRKKSGNFYRHLVFLTIDFIRKQTTNIGQKIDIWADSVCLVNKKSLLLGKGF
jgi:hypothetical protein